MQGPKGIHVLDVTTRLVNSSPYATNKPMTAWLTPRDNPAKFVAI
jgi:hypothetical protein